MTGARGDDLLRRVDSLAAAGDFESVVELADAAVRAGSKRLLLHFRLIAACLRSNRYARARELTRAAAMLAPAQPAELVELARRLLYFNLAGDLRALVQRLLARPSWSAAAEADVAALLSMAGEQDLARQLLDRAMAIAGASASTLYNRSQMHLYSGRLDAAEADLRQCLRADPGQARAHWALSKLPATLLNDEDLAATRAALARAAPGSAEAVFLHFALFNRFDRRGEISQAWQALELGCRAKRALLRYEPARSRDLYQALGQWPGAGEADALAAPAVPGRPTPIFIVGMHRSGTTLLERVLGNHGQVAEGGELYDFPAQLRLAWGRHFEGPCDPNLVAAVKGFDFAAIGAGYLEQVAWRAGGRAFLVDKLPSQFLNIGFLRRALPAAKIIHMQRDPMDTCFSNLKELFSNACPYSYEQNELADYYAGYRGLMQHWRQTQPGFVLDVRYEDLARDPRREAERILAFCGLPWDEACLDIGGNTRAVNTASSAQVREPIHQRSIQAWRRYEAQLQPLAARLSALGVETGAAPV